MRSECLNENSTGREMSGKTPLCDVGMITQQEMDEQMNTWFF